MLLSPVQPSGLSVSEPIAISDAEDMIPKAYRRLGVGRFELEIMHKDTWKRRNVENTITQAGLTRG